MRRLYLILLTLVLSLLIPLLVLEAKPRWVRMMKDDNTNYFKAIKRYDRYWSKHYHPNEEKENPRERELKDTTDPRPLLVRLFQSEERAREKSNQLIIEYKNFKKWKYEMLQYVKADGTLMSKEERLEAWKKIQNQ